MSDGFPIRNRGVHLPDHIHRLELISSPRSPRQPQHADATATNNANRTTDSSSCVDSSPRRALGSTSFRPLPTPQFTRDFVTRFENSPPLNASLSANDDDQRICKTNAQHATVAATATGLGDDFANVFGNLSAWIDASLHKCVFHAGFAKIRLYAFFLQLFLDEIVGTPRDGNSQVRRAMWQLDAYVQYLSSEDSDLVASHTQLPARGSGGTVLPSTTTTTVPRHPLLRTDRLSPKANFQNAALVLQMLSPRSKVTTTTTTTTTATIQSPRLLRSPRQPINEDQQQQDQHKQLKAPTPLTYPKRKKIVHMSDHEEHILELALYFEETLRKMGGGGPSQSPSKASTTKTKSTNKKAKDFPSTSAVDYTTQWLLLTSDEKHRVLRQRKKQLACQDFFPCSSAYSSIQSSLISNSPVTSSDLELISALIAARTSTPGASSGPSKPVDDRHNHKMGLASYFSLIVLCLHESIRRVGVFSLELAEFAWKVLCEDMVLLCEDMFATIMNNQKQAQQQLHKLKHEKMALQQQILDLEGEIQRLQTQNMRSLTMCNLKKQEFLRLEREEQWHAHCKALIVSCIAQLQGSVNTPTWLQKHSPSAADIGDTIVLEEEEQEDSDDKDDEDSDEDGLGSQTRLQQRLGDYQRLAPGFAAFHFRNRFQVIYIAHLALLCRSYLHLHERRDVCDVMNSTSISSGTGAPGEAALDHRHSQTATPGLGDDWQHQSYPLPENNSTASFFLGSTPMDNTNPMEKISLSELHTLREINDALRAVEVLYAETGATSSGQLGISSSSDTTETNNNNNRKRDLNAGSITRSTLRRPRAQQRSFGTQFPVMGAGSVRSFLRSLSYCTIAATTLSSSNFPSSSSLFLPVGTSARLQAEIEMHHENVIVTPMGSGRRRSSVRFKDATQASTSSSSSSSQQQHQHHQQPQPQIRLNKAVLKLPRHMKELLVLPLVEDSENGGGDGAAVEPFSASDPARSIATCLPTHEIVDKIHGIYRMALNNAYASSSSSSAVGGGLSDLLPVSLSSSTTNFSARSSQTEHSWTCENFVEFIYSGLLKAENGDLERCEREFVRFFASVQLLLTNNNSSHLSSHTGSNASSSIAFETISLFALLVKMQFPQIEQNARKERHTLPPRVFPMFFYCQRVLLHVSITKRRIENSGFSLDVWTLQTPDELNNWGNANQSSLLRRLPTKRALATMAGTNSSSQSTPFVLLESVKVLMVHVVSFAFASDVAPMLEERYQYLLDKSTVVTVSFLTPVTPGPYNLNSSSSSSSSSGSGSGFSSTGMASNGPNGQLAEAHIVPMDLAITTIVHLWLHVHFDVEHRLGITLQGGLTDKGDERLSFGEFVHVMTAEGSPQQQHTAATMGSGPGSGSGPGGGGASITRARLAQIYAAAQSKAYYSRTGGGGTANDVTLHWKQLLIAIVDNVDIMGMHERFLSGDFRSIQQHLSAPGNSAINPIGPLSSWLLSSNISTSSTATSMRNGSSLTMTPTQALLKSWQLHQKSMHDHISLAFQAESALDGVRCWQTGNLRLDKVQNLLRGVSEHSVSANSSTTTRKLRRGGSSLVGAGAAGDAPASNPKDKPTGNVPRNGDEEEGRNAPPPSVQELDPDALGVAWKAYQLLQWDHTRAHQFADQARIKQQRMQKNTTSSITTIVQAQHSSPLNAIAAAQPQQLLQQQTLTSPGKVEEIRPQRPLAPTKTAQRPQRS